MCGRFHLEFEDLKEIERIVGEIDRKRVNTGDIYPSNQALVITGKDTHLKTQEMRFGFPQKQASTLLINARTETVLEKRTFSDSILHRRCIIPASFFYEWNAKKEKVSFFLEDNRILYMAGFYNLMEGEERFVILTTSANASVECVHDRMPLILDESELKSWVYDDRFMEYALHKSQPPLKKHQEYEQQSLLGMI